MDIKHLVRNLVLFVALSLIVEVSAASEPASTILNPRPERPFQSEYRIHKDGAVTLRICFNWSCARADVLTFTAEDMDKVIDQMALCSAASLHDRLQRIRLGIWQMELLAQKYQPLLANDQPGNEHDREVQGRMDCVDNASNTTTFLRIFRDISALPGWSVEAPRTRNPLPLDAVHWTAVVKDVKSGRKWSVDSWFRPHGHLPFVMPLSAWQNEKKAWEPPFNAFNASPRFVNEICKTAGTVGDVAVTHAE